ncbi:MAG: hypothetical protein R2875_12150 [Desulfobacterales bacterium]
MFSIALQVVFMVGNKKNQEAPYLFTMGHGQNFFSFTNAVLHGFLQQKRAFIPFNLSPKTRAGSLFCGRGKNKISHLVESLFVRCDEMHISRYVVICASNTEAKSFAIWDN